MKLIVDNQGTRKSNMNMNLKSMRKKRYTSELLLCGVD